ncbi:MAG: hypothetical protein ACKO1M_04360 [Planctomycetota bacterium]
MSVATVKGGRSGGASPTWSTADYTVATTLLQQGGTIKPGSVTYPNNDYAQAVLSDVGSMTVYGNYTQQANATLAGTLQVNLLGGFTPAPGATFNVLTAASSINASALTLSDPAWSFQVVGNTLQLVNAPPPRIRPGRAQSTRSGASPATGRRRSGPCRPMPPVPWRSSARPGPGQQSIWRRPIAPWGRSSFGRRCRPPFNPRAARWCSTTAAARPWSRRLRAARIRSRLRFNWRRPART